MSVRGLIRAGVKICVDDGRFLDRLFDIVFPARDAINIVSRCSVRLSDRRPMVKQFSDRFRIYRHYCFFSLHVMRLDFSFRYFDECEREM